MATSSLCWWKLPRETGIRPPRWRRWQSHRTSEMKSSGLFKDARYGLQAEELLNLVRYFTWNFPSFALPDQREELRQRLESEAD